jgi:hypothetical protein
VVEWLCGGLAVDLYLGEFIGIAADEEFPAARLGGDPVGTVGGSGIDEAACLLAAAVCCAVVLIRIALGHGGGCGDKCQGGGGKLIHPVVAEGELGGGIAAKLSLPSGDITIWLMGVVELAENAGGIDAVSKVGEGLEATEVVEIWSD